MNLKFKSLGLGLLAAMAMGSIAVMNASATVSGHFTHDAAGGTATITGKETFGTAHRLKFSVTGGTPIECDVAHYNGSVGSATVTTIEVMPSYSQCHTENAAPETVTVFVNNCKFVFHSRTSGHATTGIKCPSSIAGIVIIHPNCVMRIPSQMLTGVTYGTVTEGGKHKITLNSTVGGITAHYEDDICIFLGTQHTATMIGSATVEALGGGAPVNLTAT